MYNLNWLTDYIGVEWLMVITLCIGMLIGWGISLRAYKKIMDNDAQNG